MDMLKELKESKIKSIREGMKNLPKAITFPQFLSMVMIVKTKGLHSYEILPNNTCQSLLPCLALIRPLDCGIRMVSFTLGTSKKIKKNNIIGGDKEYVGTPGLWELIVATTPNNKMFTNGDYHNYAEIMHSTHYLRRNNSKGETKLKANRSWK